MNEWENAQKWERDWWINNPSCHAHEILKGDIVAGLLGIRDMPTKSVIDIGCGPFSILQRVSVAKGVAVDPIYYGPLEILYKSAGISRIISRGEDLVPNGDLFDEAWIYNCLQHVEMPMRVIERAMSVAKRVRIFEWINVPPYTCHLHMLTTKLLSHLFHEAKWAIDCELVGKANHSGLVGDFFVGIYSRP